MKPVVCLLAVFLIASAAATAQMPDPATENRNFAQLAQIGPALNAQKHWWQRKVKASPAPTVIVVTPPAPACPVSMQAKQGSDGGLVQVRRYDPDGVVHPQSGPSQQIHLILGRFPKGNRVIAATVTVLGLTPRNRLSQTNLYAGPAPSDMRRTLEVNFTEGDDGTVSAELDLPGFSAVNSLRVESLTYADGSIWQMGDSRFCTVTPDLLMRVDAR